MKKPPRSRRTPRGPASPACGKRCPPVMSHPAGNLNHFPRPHRETVRCCASDPVRPHRRRREPRAIAEPPGQKSRPQGCEEGPPQGQQARPRDHPAEGPEAGGPARPTRRLQDRSLEATAVRRAQGVRRAVLPVRGDGPRRGRAERGPHQAGQQAPAPRPGEVEPANAVFELQLGQGRTGRDRLAGGEPGGLPCPVGAVRGVLIPSDLSPVH